MNEVISKDGTRIAFDRFGEGPALILVSGALSFRAINPKVAQLAALLPRFSLFHYDRRGRGDSGDTLPYAVEREVEDLAAVIKEAGGQAFVYGMSSGAVLALEAANRGLAITRLALYEPPLITDDSRPSLPEDYIRQLTGLLEAGRRGDAIEYFLTRAVGMPAEAVAPLRQAPVWPAFESIAHTLAYDNAIVGDAMSGRPLPAGRWAAVTMPTLVIDGGASPAWMRNAVQALVNILPNAQRRTLVGQTHDVAPEALAPVLAEFFAG